MDYLNRVKNKKYFYFILFIILIISFFLLFKSFKLNNLNNKESISLNSFSEKVSFFTDQKDYAKINLALNEVNIEAEVVFSQEAKSLGLSRRKNLEKDKGMLFIFENETSPNFVMREMNFPLDILFLRQGRIEKIFHNLAPEGIIVTNNYSYGPADMVLELPGNYASENNLVEGLSFSIIEK